MKKLILFFSFIVCTKFLISQTAISSCSASDSIKALYLKDADRLALRRIYALNLTYKDSIIIPQTHTEPFLKALIAVYNATTLPARNAVVSQYNIHTFPIPNMNSFYVAADSNLTWVHQLKLGNIPTGNIQVDGLISTYHLHIQNYNSYYGWFPYHVITFASDSNYNIRPLDTLFANISGVSFSEQIPTIGDGNDISASIYPNYVQVIYLFKWGDCPAGCTAVHYWVFNVYNDCSVEFAGEYGNSLPPPTVFVSGSNCTNKTLTVNILGANTYSLNNQSISVSQFTLSSSTPTLYTISASNNTSLTTVTIPIIDCSPAISVSGSNCVNETLTVNISGANLCSLNNQSVSISQFTVSSATPTTYVILASNGTYSTSQSILIVDCSTTTSINENKLSSSFLVYPNPTNEILNVELETINEKQIEIYVYDVLGNTVIHNATFKIYNSINVASLPKGIYFVKVGKHMQKFVKE